MIGGDMQSVKAQVSGQTAPQNTISEASLFDRLSRIAMALSGVASALEDARESAHVIGGCWFNDAAEPKCAAQIYDGSEFSGRLSEMADYTEELMSRSQTIADRLRVFTGR